MFDELDTVRLTVPLPEEGLSLGAIGAIVAIWGDKELYEVEFTDGARTLALVPVTPDKLALVEKFTLSRQSIPAD